MQLQVVRLTLMVSTLPMLIDLGWAAPESVVQGEAGLQNSVKLSCVIGGDKCARDIECCSSRCVLKKCQLESGRKCTGGGGNCISNSQCCSNNCWHSQCEFGNGCTNTGGSCISNNQCCSRKCPVLTCVTDQTFCIGESSICDTDAQCCSGLHCDSYSYKCVSKPCISEYLTCSTDSQCCSNNCYEKRCQAGYNECTGDFGHCSGRYQCCSRNCTSNRCQGNGAGQVDAGIISIGVVASGLIIALYGYWKRQI